MHRLNGTDVHSQPTPKSLGIAKNFGSDMSARRVRLAKRPLLGTPSRKSQWISPPSTPFVWISGQKRRDEMRVLSPAARLHRKHDADALSARRRSGGVGRYLDRRPRQPRPRYRARVADVSDAKALREAVPGETLDAVGHCASRNKVVESMEKPELYRRVIVEGTRNVVRVRGGSGTRRSS